MVVKDKKIEIRVTAQEKELLQRYCDNYGYSLSSYLRSVIYRDLVKHGARFEEVNG